MKRFKVNLFLCAVAAVLITLLLAPAVADAAAWSVVPSPNASPGNNELHAVASVSANDVWVVGSSLNASGVDQTLIEQWNGHKWSVVSSPNASTQNNLLRGVTVVSANDIWAVGSSQNNGLFQPLAEHW